VSDLLSIVLSPKQNPIWLNVLVIFLAGVPIWFLGGRMARAADTIGQKTSLGTSFAGLLLLASATSLPDIATTVTASLLGDVRLAVAALMGSVALQLVVLAVADAASRGSITYENPQPETLLQCGILGFLLGMVVLLVSVGEPVTFGSVGLGSILLFVAFGVGLLLRRRSQGQTAWQPKSTPEKQPSGGDDEESVRGAVLIMVGSGVVVLVGGVLLARSASALASQTGLGSIVVGATLVAAVTSLPEISTTVSSARRGAQEMAFGNILGTNALNVAMLFLADLAYTDGTALTAAGQEAEFLAALGIVLTCVYLVGMVFRSRWTWLRMGPDSLTTIVLYLAGVALLVYSTTKSSGGG